MTGCFSKTKALALSIASATALSIGFATNAQAAGIISNGVVQLGVDSTGELNIFGPSSAQGTPYVGLRFVPTNNEATAAGCLCEGWGVADAVSRVSMFANNSSGDGGIGSFVFTMSPDGKSAKSIVTEATGVFEVTHNYVPDERTPYLYRTEVTIRNIGTSTVTDLRYRRLMDWDIEPTAFSELVTIKGSSTASNVIATNNNGFASSNPLIPASELFSGGTGDFTNLGPADHGALFDFAFGAIAAGAQISFNTYYGAAPDEALALAALGSVGVEVYSLAKARGSVAGEPNTFMFGFTGVGGSPVLPNPIPTPALLPGLIGMGVATLRRRKAETAEQANEA